MMNAINVFKILLLVLTSGVILFIGFSLNLLQEHIAFRGWNSTARITREQSVEVTDEVPLMSYGPVSNCSLDDIRQTPGVMMLTTANLAFVDVVLNMLASVRRVGGVCVNTTVIAEDQMANDALKRYTRGDPAVHILKTSSGEMGVIEASRRDMAEYYGLMNKRQGYILSLLKRGFEVLFTDSDTFWFRDPFPYFVGNYDMFVRGTPSHGTRRRINETNFCAGFMYLKPTIATIQFVRAWVKVMEDNKKRGSFLPDQKVMNRLLKDDKPVHVNIKMLDPDLFPWGPRFFNASWQKENHSTVVMHAANIRGHPQKVGKFKKFDMWLVNVTDLAGDPDIYKEPFLLALLFVFFLLFVIGLLLVNSHAGS